jgi:hypothetical protein
MIKDDITEIFKAIKEVLKENNVNYENKEITLCRNWDNVKIMLNDDFEDVKEYYEILDLFSLSSHPVLQRITREKYHGLPEKPEEKAELKVEKKNIMGFLKSRKRKPS